MKQVSVNKFSSFQNGHFWSKLGRNYQFVVRFIFVFLFLRSLQQVSFYFVVNDRFSYLKVCSVHYKICVLQKFNMSFFICLKFICGKVREFLYQTWLATLKYDSVGISSYKYLGIWVVLIL